ncbi:MAG: TetR/AcrR family transcriptional regulator [Deltaproteobacteria bacterium]|nr:TetR/AcrR family transcriptional regulator [Deltaproteobacteria bacterium]MBW1928002.1 TetR/AcrR family transcriptional regulator [Deltaproteobacteria bacterium]MBW2024163.1 TetR/AcrR family transcriptional regulator [Deltaproteobacteria bacterium]MBW2124445.1 TetR/AcrR family transcriptional regulator [Deltaproteobacteria bacterium]RLB19854.1 MAG: TetR family transcriptional regulator [Deltaproteobacteria bacterium]
MPKKRDNGKYFKIIEAATKIFAEKGFYQSRVSDIAREAGVADGTIYIYFDNKDDILISLFEEQMRLVLENMISKISSLDDPAEKLKAFALTHLRLVEENQSMAEIIQVELRQSSKFIKEYKNEQFAKYLEIIAQIIQEGQQKGVFRKDIIPGIAKRAFFGALDEMSRFWVLSSRRDYDIKTAALQISQYFLEGMKA